MACAIFFYTIDDFNGGRGIDEIGCAYLHGSCTSHEEFEGVAGTPASSP